MVSIRQNDLIKPRLYQKLIDLIIDLRQALMSEGQLNRIHKDMAEQQILRRIIEPADEMPRLVKASLSDQSPALPEYPWNCRIAGCGPPASLGRRYLA